MTAPINLYRDEHNDIEREWMPRDEQGKGYTMTLKSLKPREDKDGCWKGIFEVEPNLLYSQLFWENSTDMAMLEALMKNPITCDIEIKNGFQRITNIDIIADTPQDTLALKTRREQEADKDVPF